MARQRQLKKIVYVCTYLVVLSIGWEPKLVSNQQSEDVLAGTQNLTELCFNLVLHVKVRTSFGLVKEYYVLLQIQMYKVVWVTEKNDKF